MIRVGIVGGAGYTGGELIRLLLNHPMAKITYVQSRSQSGLPISNIHQDLLGETDLVFEENAHHDVDVIFFCTGHGETSKLIPEMNIPSYVKIIDLSNDFRLSPENSCNGLTFTYGLPEINKNGIVSAKAIANPGCFATAIQLAILPLLDAGHHEDFYITAITGSTGAGQSLSATSHFSWRTNNIQAYKTLTHQHLAEIKQSCQQVTTNAKIPAINFVPWRGDFARGIFCSVQTKSSKSKEELDHIYETFYKDAKFTTYSYNPIHLKQVINTNKCLIQLEKTNDQIVIHSVIDNLLKGASGQAVQNMNIMFGLSETLGLNLKALAF